MPEQDAKARVIPRGETSLLVLLHENIDTTCSMNRCERLPRSPDLLCQLRIYRARPVLQPISRHFTVPRHLAGRV